MKRFNQINNLKERISLLKMNPSFAFRCKISLLVAKSLYFL